VREDALVGWVLEVVSSVLGRERRVPTRSAVEGHLSAPTMLSVLTYCYATGCYASEEIETLTATDRTVCYLCANQMLNSVEVRHFRRSNRELLHSCLLALHRRAWQHRFGSLRGSTASSSDLARAGCTRGGVLVFRLAAAAEQKIQQAVLADTMALDD